MNRHSTGSTARCGRGAKTASCRTAAGAAIPAKQPVLLSTEPQPANGAKVALLLDGSDADPGLFERCMVVFDGGDETARAKARQQYKAALDAGGGARYFQQERSGGWKEFKKDEPSSQS